VGRASALTIMNAASTVPTRILRCVADAWRPWSTAWASFEIRMMTPLPSGRLLVRRLGVVSSVRANALGDADLCVAPHVSAAAPSRGPSTVVVATIDRAPRSEARWSIDPRLRAYVSPHGRVADVGHDADAG
jgi:hypothetical protein